jgi:hypothetical protein
MNRLQNSGVVFLLIPIHKWLRTKYSLLSSK